MKVCLVHEEYPDETNFGGIATYQKRLAESLVQKGNEVIVITRGLKKESEEIKNGVRVIRLYVKETEDIYNNYYSYREKVCDKLKELQNHNEIEIIEVPDWGAETILFEKYRKIPLIVHLHTPLLIWSINNQSTLDSSIHEQMLKWEKKMIESADKVISCTNILKDMVIKEMKLKRTDLEVLPNPANLKDFYSKNEKKEKSRTILYCGSMEQRKGVIVFAKAIPQIIDSLGNIKILFVGKDTNRNEKNISTKEYIYSLIPDKYHKQIDFKGQLLNIEMNDIYNSSSIGVFPSVFDNFPYVILESMACGLPFIGSINSGAKEILNNETKYLYDGKTSTDLAEKLICLYNDKKSQKEYSEFIKNRVREVYDSEIVIDKFISLYKNTIKKYMTSIINEVFEKNVNEEIVELKKIEGGVCNILYLVTTQKKKYIAKIYRNAVDKDAISELIKISKTYNINVLNQADCNFYDVHNRNVCLYEYIEGKHIKKLTENQINKILDFIKIDKPCNSKYTNMLEKVDFYYNSLRIMKTKKISRNLIDELLKKYMKLQNHNIFYERELIHGDLSPTSIIWDNSGNFTLIDLDETVIFTKLYDLVVFAIKFSKNGSEIDTKIAKKILKPFDDYTKVDIINIWNFYILKVLLEKIYLYEIDKIDLLDENTNDDKWEDWYHLLNSNIIEDILNK